MLDGFVSELDYVLLILRGNQNNTLNFQERWEEFLPLNLFKRMVRKQNAISYSLCATSQACLVQLTEYTNFK